MSWWHDRDRLLAELDEHGSYAEISRVHGVATSTLKSWRVKHGLPVRPRSTAVVHKPDSEISEAEVLRARVRELEAHIARQREGDVMEERLLQRLETAIEAAEPRYAPPVIRRSSTVETQELVLLFSDTHASEVVRAEETEGMNAYDWQVMSDRMRLLQESVLRHKDHMGFPVEKLHVFLLGDLLSGDIHDELAITNDRPTAEAVVDFAYLFSAWLEELVPHFAEIEVCGVPGNHPRATKKPSNKQAHNNADWLTYKMTEAILRLHPSIAFDFGTGSYKTCTVAERWRCLLMHGDGIRSTMPGVPWGGVTRRISTLEAQFTKARKPIDYVMLGHFHSANTLDGVSSRTFLNSSVKGLDEYSLKNFGHGRDASQLLLSFHRRRGWTGTYPIDLQTVTPASEGWGVLTAA